MSASAVSEIEVIVRYVDRAYSASRSKIRLFRSSDALSRA
jgi:hypothetical protein